MIGTLDMRLQRERDEALRELQELDMQRLAAEARLAYWDELIALHRRAGAQALLELRRQHRGGDPLRSHRVARRAY